MSNNPPIHASIPPFNGLSISTGSVKLCFLATFNRIFLNNIKHINDVIIIVAEYIKALFIFTPLIKVSNRSKPASAIF